MTGMELIEKLTPDFSFPDDRGLLVQLVHEGYRQVNAVFTKKGAVRGNYHYHRNTDEVFFILNGRVEITAVRDKKRESAVFSTGDMFRIPVEVRHNCSYLEDTNLVVLYSVPVDQPDGTRDIIPDPNIKSQKIPF